MAKKASSHSAAPSAVGYYHQGLFALVTLLDAGDDGGVSVETEDDVVLEGPNPVLHQIKHSLGAPPLLTLTNEGLWKTLAIWCGGPLDGSVKYVFVTCAPLDRSSPLAALTQDGAPRDAVLKALEDEAKRVKQERAAAGVKRPLPHAKRWPGCEAFLNLRPKARKSLVGLISITPDSYNAAQVPDIVASRLRNCVPPLIRGPLVEGLIEWWDRQVALSLLKRRARTLRKLELQRRVLELIVEHSPANLPDNFGLQEPPSLAGVTGRTMAKQIELVKGGQARVSRAALVRWQAREQRQKWLADDLASATDLDQLDRCLAKAWSDRFGPMKDDCEGAAGEVCCQRGRDLLDWTHHEAHRSVPPVRPLWGQAFVVQGSFQQLAEESKVGWHPDFANLLKAGGP